MNDPLYRNVYPHWAASYKPDPRRMDEVTGLAVHCMTKSGRGHSEPPDWVKQQTQEFLRTEHKIYHENGGHHK